MVKECALKENSCEFHQTRLSVNKRKAAKMRGSLGSGQGTEMRTERQVHDADSFSVSFPPDGQKAQSRKAVLRLSRHSSSLTSAPKLRSSSPSQQCCPFHSSSVPCLFGLFTIPLSLFWLYSTLGNESPRNNNCRMEVHFLAPHQTHRSWLSNKLWLLLVDHRGQGHLL